GAPWIPRPTDRCPANLVAMHRQMQDPGARMTACPACHGHIEGALVDFRLAATGEGIGARAAAIDHIVAAMEGTMQPKILVSVSGLVLGAVLALGLNAQQAPASAQAPAPAPAATAGPAPGIPPDFKGTIKLDVRDSKEDWGPFTPKKAPAGAPNFLFIL